MAGSGIALRILIDPALDGRYNMALDRAVQICVEDGDSPPSLRLYRWAVPTATVGRFQRIETVDVEYARQAGVALARRFTGGRGVLHADELTYAFVASRAHGVPEGIERSYAYIAGALVRSFTNLGVEAALKAGDGRASDSGSCYLTSTAADLCAGAAKLSGSAQVWLGSTVLQHGCFVRSRDVTREASVFRLDEGQARRLGSTASTLEALLDTIPTFPQMEQAVIDGFVRSLDMEPVAGTYLRRELELAEILASADETRA